MSVVPDRGKPLARVADFDKIEPESGKGGDETRRTVGQVWELRCFETGGFIGAPDEAYKEIGGPPVQRPPQGFLTKLCYISARLSPVARGDIGGIFAFTAPTRLIGASKSDDVATTSVTKKEAVASDPVSSLTKDENSETTTFRRDGKTILKSILYHSTEPEKRLLLQRVIFHDEVVVDLTDFRGKRAFSIHPNPHVSVGIQQDLSTGALKSVGLMDDSNGIIEAFEVKDSHLTPVSGKQLELDRAVTKDVGELLAPDNVKKSTPEEFGHHVKEVYKKCHTEKSVPQEGSPGNDKPPPQDPSPSK